MEGARGCRARNRLTGHASHDLHPRLLRSPQRRLRGDGSLHGELPWRRRLRGRGGSACQSRGRPRGNAVSDRACGCGSERPPPRTVAGHPCRLIRGRPRAPADCRTRELHASGLCLVDDTRTRAAGAARHLVRGRHCRIWSRARPERRPLAPGGERRRPRCGGDKRRAAARAPVVHRRRQLRRLIRHARHISDPGGRRELPRRAHGIRETALGRASGVGATSVPVRRLARGRVGLAERLAAPRRGRALQRQARPASARPPRALAGRGHRTRRRHSVEPGTRVRCNRELGFLVGHTIRGPARRLAAPSPRPRGQSPGPGHDRPQLDRRVHGLDQGPRPVRAPFTSTTTTSSTPAGNRTSPSRFQTTFAPASTPRACGRKKASSGFRSSCGRRAAWHARPSPFLPPPPPTRST